MTEQKKICGIVMPISAIDGCEEAHWRDVCDILKEAILMADFEGNLVSDADDIGIIQKRIIQNLYDNPIVVCDVSGKNPNVMFELGMRLAFDKPTIIIKDNRTTYSFDTSPIEHLEYPRDLRFAEIVEFKEKLAHKIKTISQQSSNNAAYSPFLHHFGEFKVAKIDQKEVSGQEYIIDELRSIKLGLARMEHRVSSLFPDEDYKWRIKALSHREFRDSDSDIDICLINTSIVLIDRLQKDLSISHEFKDLIKDFEIYSVGGHKHLSISLCEGADSKIIEGKIKLMLKRKELRVKKRNNDI